MAGSVGTCRDSSTADQGRDGGEGVCMRARVCACMCVCVCACVCVEQLFVILLPAEGGRGTEEERGRATCAEARQGTLRVCGCSDESSTSRQGGKGGKEDRAALDSLPQLPALSVWVG